MKLFSCFDEIERRKKLGMFWGGQIVWIFRQNWIWEKFIFWNNFFGQGILKKYLNNHSQKVNLQNYWWGYFLASRLGCRDFEKNNFYCGHSHFFMCNRNKKENIIFDKITLKKAQNDPRWHFQKKKKYHKRSALKSWKSESVVKQCSPNVVFVVGIKKLKNCQKLYFPSCFGYTWRNVNGHN